MATEDFNSSDMEMGAPPVRKQAAFHGQASIDEILKHAESDRLTSKVTVKQLQWGHGAPGTQRSQALWLNRFNAFRRHTLKQSLTTPFTGDDLLRFFDSIIGTLGLALLTFERFHRYLESLLRVLYVRASLTRSFYIGKIKPVDDYKHAPNHTVVTSAFQVLLSYGEFTWDEGKGFKITRHDGLRLQTWIDDAVKANRLTKGHWRKKSWIGFVTLSRMVRTFLNHCHTHGCWSWDVVISKCLSVVLVAALGARSGDVTRTAQYRGSEYLQWRHIEMYCHGEAKFENLTVTITLEFEKGSKDTRNKETLRYLRPLEDFDSLHVCPTALLVIHALRHGLVHGSTLQEVLNHAAASPSRRVIWTSPDLPVLTQIARKPSRCDLTRPAPSQQLYETIKQMGLISSILTRTYMHAVRLGAARDIAHLPNPTRVSGACTDEVRQYLGHRANTGAAGITEQYVGGSSREYYNDREKNQFEQNRREPKFSEESAYQKVKAPVTMGEIQIWKDNNAARVQGSSYSTTRIQHIIRRERLEQFMQTAAPETPDSRNRTINSSILTPLSPSKMNQSTTTSSSMLTPLSPSKVSTRSRSVHVRKTVRERNRSSDSISNHLTDSESEYEATSFEEAFDEASSANIDPALLDDVSTEQVEVAQDDLRRLQASIFPTEEASKDATALPNMSRTGSSTGFEVGTSCNEQVLLEESTQLLLGADNRQTTTLTAGQWIDRYARINIVQSAHFGAQWLAYTKKSQAFEGTIGQNSVRGNSRDDPTPWIWHCLKTKGCTYQSVLKGLLTQHETVCTETLVAALQEGFPESSLFPCTWPDCHKTYGQMKSLTQHVKLVHEWKPVPCEHGCEPFKIYQTGSAYTDHQSFKHSGRWPTPCLYPGCTSDQAFNSAGMVKYHLNKAHGITDPQQRLQYLPPLRAKEKWEPQPCLRPDCLKQAILPSRSRMREHLTGLHKMTEAAANALMDEQGVVTTITTQLVLHKSSRRVSKRALGTVGKADGEGEATDDEKDVVGRTRAAKSRRRG